MPTDVAKEPNARVAWSCVLDDTTALWDHFLVWVATLVDCAGAPPEAIVVHHVAELRHDVRQVAARLGLRTQQIPRFDRRSPHANKISQCFTDFGGAGRVVLTDVDLAFLAPPPLGRIRAPVAGKPVDFPNPPVEVLCDLFRRAGLPLPDRRLPVAFLDAAGVLDEFQTFPANYNGGFYVIDSTILPALGSAWAHWTRWLLDAALIPTRYAVHVDQIAFCMAVHALGLDAAALESAWNFPTHVPTPPVEAAPFVAHHHGQLEDALLLPPLRPVRHEALIANANAAISAFLRRHGVAPTAGDKSSSAPRAAEA